MNGVMTVAATGHAVSPEASVADLAVRVVARAANVTADPVERVTPFLLAGRIFELAAVAVLDL